MAVWQGQNVVEVIAKFCELNKCKTHLFNVQRDVFFLHRSNSVQFVLFVIQFTTFLGHFHSQTKNCSIYAGWLALKKIHSQNTKDPHFAGNKIITKTAAAWVDFINYCVQMGLLKPAAVYPLYQVIVQLGDFFLGKNSKGRTWRFFNPKQNNNWNESRG